MWLANRIFPSVRRLQARLAALEAERNGSSSTPRAIAPQHTDVTRLDLGCGDKKRADCYGVDFRPRPGVDCVLNIASEPWPFADNSIEYIFSNHAFEHLPHPGPGFGHVLTEIFRVCKHNAQIEIWTPYGPSRDAFILGHTIMFNERIWQDCCFQGDRVWLGDRYGYFLWEETEYCLRPGIVDELKPNGIDLDFALSHMFDICYEWRVQLRVKKDSPQAPGPQTPRRLFSYARGEIAKQI